MEILIYTLVALPVIFVPYYVGKFFLDKIDGNVMTSSVSERYWFGILSLCGIATVLLIIIAISQSIINSI